MLGTLYVVLEAHARCATLYLQGPLDAEAAERALTLCGALPPAIRDLRIDARGLDLGDALTAAALRAVVRTWHLTGADQAAARGVVTISLQDRGLGETRSGHVPFARRKSSAAALQGCHHI